MVFTQRSFTQYPFSSKYMLWHFWTLGMCVWCWEKEEVKREKKKSSLFKKKQSRFLMQVPEEFAQLDIKKQTQKSTIHYHLKLNLIEMCWISLFLCRTWYGDQNVEPFQDIHLLEASSVDQGVNFPLTAAVQQHQTTFCSHQEVYSYMCTETHKWG